MTITAGDEPGVCQDAPPASIYDQLIEWSVWATGRLDIVDSTDHVAPQIPATFERREALARLRREDLTIHLEAIEKAVAHLEPKLLACVRAYFIDRKTVARIAADENDSEHHVVNYLYRAFRILAREVPLWEARLS